MAECTVRIGFYRVTVNPKTNHQKSFEEILDAADKSPDDESRTVSRPDGPIRLQFVRKSASVWQGEFIRIRLGEEPKRANLKGKVEPIHFETDEGLGEESAFLYDPVCNIIAYHEHRGGVGLINAGKYLKSVGDVRSIQFSPVIREEALERVAGMGRIREFVVHLAGIPTGHSLKGVGKSALALFNAASAFQAPKAQIRLQVGKENGLSKVVEAIRELLHSGEDVHDKVTKLVVIGSEAEGTDLEDEAIIDLLQDRLVVPWPVQLKTEKLTDAQRRGAVYDAWRVRKDELRKRYAEQG